MSKYGLDWPSGFDRTGPDDQERTTKFSVGVRQSKRQIEKEMERLEVDNWRLDDVSGSGGEVGVVLRWQKDGQDYVVACDRYASKKANVRAVYLWVNETRMRSDRPVVTGSDEFAAARLPPGDDDREAVVASKPPHEVLGVAPDADDAVVEAAARAMKAKMHPDQAGDEEEAERLEWEFKQVVKAEEALLSESR